MSAALAILAWYALCGVMVALWSAIPGVLVSIDTRRNRPIRDPFVAVVVGCAWPWFLARWAINSWRNP